MENLINKEMPCSSYCWLANRFAIITEVPDYLRFIWGELNMAVLEENSRINFVGKNSSKEINSHFTNLLIFSELNALEVLEFCRESLNKNRFILIKVDKFFIKACSQYNARHEFYEILIYGENEYGFSFLNLNDRTKVWDRKMLSGNELCDGFLSASSLRKYNYDEFLNIFAGNESLCVSAGIKSNLKFGQQDYDFLSDIKEIGKKFSSIERTSIVDNQNIDYLIIYLKVLIDIRTMFVSKMHLLSDVKLETNCYNCLCDKIISKYKKKLMILVRCSIKSDESVRNDLIEETIELINENEKQLWAKLYEDISDII